MKVRIRNGRLRALVPYLKTEACINANSTEFLNRMLNMRLSASPGFTDKNTRSKFFAVAQLQCGTNRYLLVQNNWSSQTFCPEPNDLCKSQDFCKHQMEQNELIRRHYRSVQHFSVILWRSLRLNRQEFIKYFPQQPYSICFCASFRIVSFTVQKRWGGFNQ